MLGRILSTIGALVVVLAAPIPTAASGSYAGRPPRPPSSVDRQLYEAGKKVFAGEVASPEAADRADSAAEQRRLLEAIEASIPRKDRARARFTELAGSLSAAQVEALRYFVSKRFGAGR